MSDPKRVKIVSGGLASNTKVFVGDEEIKGVVSVCIHPMKPGAKVAATIEVISPELDIELIEAVGE